MKTIRSKIYFLMTFFAVHSYVTLAAFSAPDLKSVPSQMKCIIYCNLAPTTPKEANFDEYDGGYENTNYSYLKPITPGEADFDETTGNDVISIPQTIPRKLSPVTPRIAEFDEIYEVNPGCN
jgi:hypothetical protein